MGFGCGMRTTRFREFPQLWNWYQDWRLNWGSGITQESPTGDLASRRYPQPGVLAFFGRPGRMLSCFLVASALQEASGSRRRLPRQAPLSEAAPAALEHGRMPESGPAPDARAGVARVFHCRVGPRRGLPFRRWRDRSRSLSVGLDRFRHVAICFDRSRLVSASLDRPQSASTGLGRPRSVSVGLNRLWK